MIDEARILVRAGDGGHGSASFHREKYKPKGGPDGGDGGHGGSVILEAHPSVSTLSEFRLRRMFRAKDGARGSGNNKRGGDGRDLIVRVPIGTVVHDLEADEILADLAKPGARAVAARGGRGGRGNAGMASAVDRAPNFAERGEPGDERELLLDLRVVADVGLLGLPNAGKSTLLAALSNARPKVADYPFTTLHPYLGVVELDDERFALADLPGLIEGAAEGRGLGTRFLRHAERCALLACVVDLAGDDPAGALETVAGEVDAYEPEMADRIGIVVGNKVDLPEASDQAARAWAQGRGMPFLAVSAREGAGLDDLRDRLAALVREARVLRPEPESFAVFRPVAADRIAVTREADGAYRVSSHRVERLVGMMPLGNPRAVRYLQRRLATMGVDAALQRHGVKEGDEVRIGQAAFEYHPTPERRRP